MNQEKIDRINELYHKSKSQELTDEEKREQAALRREYIDAYKASLVGQLENTYYIDENGHKKKVTRKSQK